MRLPNKLNIRCVVCGTNVNLNTQKHRYRKKWCPSCGAMIFPRQRDYPGNPWWEWFKQHTKNIRNRYFRRYVPTAEPSMPHIFTPELVTAALITPMLAAAAIVKRRRTQGLISR